jgi:toxin-antitoxin system PIN domain toxin
MILIDANLLLYAYDASSPQHQRAHTWLTSVLVGPQPVRFAWMSLLAFLRIGTDSRIFTRPLTIAEAEAAVASWLALPAVAILDPGERHWTILSGLLRAAQARAALVMDAHLAALAIEHGVTLCTSDSDFSRFPAVRLLNPLTSQAP